MSDTPNGWVMVFDPPYTTTRDYLADRLRWEIEDSIRGQVIAESPRMIRLASEQHVGLFVRPLLPRIS